MSEPSREAYYPRYEEVTPLETSTISSVQEKLTQIPIIDVAESQQSFEEHIDPAVKTRIERSRMSGELIEQLRTIQNPEELTSEMKANARWQLEQRKWKSSFEGIHPGETVMILTEPADKIFSLKTFNDKILGQQQTDTMIGFRRDSLQAHLDPIGVRMVDANFKFMTFAFDQSTITTDEINQAIAQASAEITEKIAGLIQASLETTTELNSDKHAVISSLLKTMEQTEYPVRYGTAEVNGETPSDIVVAISQGMLAARTHETQNQDYDFGQAFTQDTAVNILQSFTQLQESILSQGNSITDCNGFEYIIFDSYLSSDLKTQKKSVRYSINPDLVRAVRKKTFQPQTNADQEVLHLVESYVDVLNAVDLVRPFTQLDIQPNRDGSPPLQQELTTVNTYLENLDTPNPDITLLRETGTYLEGAMKNSDYTSRGVFHERVSHLDSSALLFIDVGDLGVDVLRTYEERLHDLVINQGYDTGFNLTDLMMQVGDRETYAMNRIRSEVSQLYKEIFQPGENEKILGLVEGGDEIMIAFDLSQEGMSDKITLFQNQLQERIKAKLRVVITSEPPEHPVGFDQVTPYVTRMDDAVRAENDPLQLIDPRLEAHIVNVQKAEQGSDLSKNIEANVRKYQFTLKTILQSFPIEQQSRIQDILLKQHLGIKEWQITDAKEFHTTEFGQAREMVFRTEFHPESNRAQREQIIFLTPREMQNHVQRAMQDLQDLRDGLQHIQSICTNQDKPVPVLELIYQDQHLILQGEGFSAPPKKIARAWLMGQVQE